MKILITEATNDQLNYLVAKLKNHEYRYPWLLEQSGYRFWQYSEFSSGRPTPDYCSEDIDLIQEECVSLIKCGINNRIYWEAIVGFEGDENHTIAFGKTMLIAGIRAYLISKHGDDVEVHDSLVL